jgi:hypothetical protein
MSERINQVKKARNMRRIEIMSVPSGVRKNASRFVVAALALIGSTASAAMAQTQQPQQQPQQQQSTQRRVRHASVEDRSPAGRLALEQEHLQYPPESVPIDTTYWDLLHPWYVDTQAHSMRTKEDLVQGLKEWQSLRLAGYKEEDAWAQVHWPASSLKSQFEMNKTTLAGTEDKLQARLTVTPTQSSDAALRLHVIKAEMIGTEEFGSPNLGAVPFTCETTGPVCTFTWQAPSADKQYWGMLRLRTTVTVEGFPGEFIATELFYSSPMVAGKFTGAFQERLDNGSLVIDAGVNVQKRMACFVSANLYSANKEIPVQHARLRLLVDPSMKTISFRFFGKIFRDYGDEGTFRLQDLKAQCENLAFPPEWFLNSYEHQADLQLWRSNNPSPQNEPGHIYFAHDNYSYTTQSYPLSAFSDAEWQSPQKTRRLEMLKKIAAIKTGQQPPQP